MATHQEVAAILAKAAEPGMRAMRELADECSRQAQAEEEAELLQTKRANARKRQAKCRAKRKQKDAFVAPMEHVPTIEHVPTMDMDTVSDYHDEHGEEEPAEATNASQEKSQRADRLEHNKQASLASFIIENLRARVPLNTNFQRLCKVCASPDVRFGRRDSVDINCHTCACTTGHQHLKATEYVDLETCRLLHPIELEEATGLRYLPLAKSCPACQHCQWARTAVAGKETVTIEMDGIWRYAAANYCCTQCGYKFEYTDPLTYTTTTHLPGKPVIASTAVSIRAIKYFITTQRHVPHYTPSAFIKCRLLDNEVRFVVCIGDARADASNRACWTLALSAWTLNMQWIFFAP